MLLLLAAALPSLFWDGGADTATAVKDAQITQILVPASKLQEWKSVPGVSAEAANPSDAVKLTKPAVNYRADEASASTAPWVDSNGWRFLRKPDGHFVYNTPGQVAALAAAEAYVYGAPAWIQTDAKGLKPLGEMLAFLKALPASGSQGPVNIGYIDDGSAQSGELMNLLVRRNFLFRLESAPDPKLDLNVAYGSADYPKTQKDPSVLQQKVRSNLGDAKRLIRLYGSEVVIARITKADGKVRVHLLNYAGANRRVQGLRVSVRGEYKHGKLSAFRAPDATLLDYNASAGVTEFTVPEIREYAVVDLEP